MDALDLVYLNLQISTTGGTEEDLDELARRLLLELRELKVETAELAKSEDAPSGTKSAEAITAGAIALSVVPAMLPKIVDFVQAWVLRGRDRTVKFKGRIGGQAIEFEGTPEDLQKVLQVLKKGK